MTPPLPQSVYRLVVNQLYQSTVQMANTFHVYSHAVTPTAEQVGVDFRDFVFPTWRTRVQSGLLFQSILVEQFVPDPTDRAVIGINQAGVSPFPVGQAAIAQPSNLAMVVTWRTDFPGRAGRGRMYLCGHWVLNSDGLHWHQTNLDGGQAIAQVIRDRYNGVANPYALRLCVFSRRDGGRKPPYSAAGARTTVAHQVQSVYATMGSRRLGRGI